MLQRLTQGERHIAKWA